MPDRPDAPEALARIVLTRDGVSVEVKVGDVVPLVGGGARKILRLENSVVPVYMDGPEPNAVGRTGVERSNFPGIAIDLAALAATPAPARLGAETVRGLVEKWRAHARDLRKAAATASGSTAQCLNAAAFENEQHADALEAALPPKDSIIATSARRVERDIDSMDAALGGKMPGPLDDAQAAPVRHDAGAMRGLVEKWRARSVRSQSRDALESGYCQALEKCADALEAALSPALDGDHPLIKAAYKRGWDDREAIILARAQALAPRWPE